MFSVPLSHARSVPAGLPPDADRHPIIRSHYGVCDEDSVPHELSDQVHALTARLAG